MKKLIISMMCLTMLSLNACAPNFINVGPEPEYYSSGTIPITVGINVHESRISQTHGKSGVDQAYGPIIADYIKKMRVFNSIVFPYGQNDTVDVVLDLTITGKWEYSNKGRAIANFLIGTPNYNDVEGNHSVRMILTKGNANATIANYDITVDTKGQYTGTDTDMIASRLTTLQAKKMAVEIATKIQEDRIILLETVNTSDYEQDKRKTPVVVSPTQTPQKKNKTSEANTEKLNKLREGGIISEEEYSKATTKLTSSQSDRALPSDKLKELDELHKSGILSDTDYNKAKERLSELQKLDELHRNGILSDEDYKKAKARILEK